MAVSGGREIVPIINDLLSLPFALKIATQDFHPQEHVSFEASHPPPNNIPFESHVKITNPSNPSDIQEIPIWPVHCVKGTKGAAIIPELNSSKLAKVLEKGRTKDVEMFSGFADCFGNKTDAASFDLAEVLREAAISHVYVVGLAGDYCVRCSAIDAKKEGFNVCGRGCHEKRRSRRKGLGVSKEGTSAIRHQDREHWWPGSENGQEFDLRSPNLSVLKLQKQPVCSTGIHLAQDSHIRGSEKTLRYWQRVELEKYFEVQKLDNNNILHLWAHIPLALVFQSCCLITAEFWQ